MCGPILVLLVVVPALEIFLMFQVGVQLGFFPTMLLVVGTGLLGLSLLRRQGPGVLARPLRGPQDPTAAEPFLMIVAVVLLVIPGFVTDAMGLCLMLPPVRRRVARAFVRRYGPKEDPTVIVIER